MLINMILPGAVEPPVDENTLLLLHGEDLTDSSVNKTALTNQGATVSTAQSKFGGSSLYFNGSSRILIPAIVFGSNDFTVDWWEYPTSSSCGARFSSEYATVSSEMGGMLLGYSGKSLYASSASNSSWDMVSGAAAFSVTANAWTHWAVVRSGNKLSTYRNGTLFWSQTISGAVYSSGKYMSAIGDYRTGDHNYFVGYIDEFRISNIARWTANFTPPTEPYDPGTGGGSSGEALEFTYSGNYTDNRVNGIGTVRLNTSGTLEVTNGKATVSAYILAGGGGGATRFNNSGYYYRYNAGGGGGGNQTVVAELTKGTYEIVIGAGGAGNNGGSASSARAGDGGSTTAFGYTSTGGLGGYASGSATAGAGGSPNGSAGTTDSAPSAEHVAASGGSPNGGGAVNSTVYAGGDGYVELTFL